MSSEVVTVNQLIHMALIIMGVWGFVKIVMEIINAITKRHDREQSWDEAVMKIEAARKEFGRTYDERLDDLDAKIQEIRAEQCLIIDCQMAILDGLGQLKCNGPVTEQKHKLEKHLNDRAHKD